MTQELFQRYIDNNCTEEETAIVEKWLRTCNEYELDRLLLERWNAQPTSMPPEAERLLWQQLYNNIASPPVHRKIFRFNKRMIVAAAAAAVIFAIACLFFLNGERTSLRTSLHKPISTVVANPEQWINIANTTSLQRKVRLEDGSEVILEKSSVLKYRPVFKDHRDIYLSGKALFKVAKDKQHPFTVFSDHVSTTALGTVFSVNAKPGDNNIIIKLFEGKIIVRSINGNVRDSMILMPGQEVVYNTRQGIMKQSIASHRTAPAPHAAGQYETTEEEMTFTNMPLPDVLDTLVHYYHQPIEYNKAGMEAINFTGIVSKKDPLNVVLDIISRMNGLQLDRKDGKYTLNKPPQ